MYKKKPVKRYKRRGGFLPLLALLPALAATAAGVASAVRQGKLAAKGRGYKRQYKRKAAGLSNMRIRSLDDTTGGAIQPYITRPARPPLMVVSYPARGRGLLAPAGGMVPHKRKAHYRYVRKGGAVKRIHVRAANVRGGYVPYH